MYHRPNLPSLRRWLNTAGSTLLVAVLAAALAGSLMPASARAHTPLQPPADTPTSELKDSGLTAAGLAVPDLVAPDSELVSEFSTLSAPSSPAWKHTRTNTEVVCVGDGASGSRVEFLYVTAKPAADLPVDRFRQTAAWMDRSLADSARVHANGFQTIRWYHGAPDEDGKCQVKPRKVVVPQAIANLDFTSSSSNTSFSTLTSYLSANLEPTSLSADAGRRYIIWFDERPATSWCGLGSFHNDSNPDPDLNRSNLVDNVGVGLVFCEADYGSVELHELVHTLGGVSTASRNSDGRGHCADGYDLMCRSSSETGCSDSEWRRLLDCGGDDYYNPAAKITSAGGAEIWNVANSRFFQSSKPAWWTGFEVFEDSQQQDKDSFGDPPPPSTLTALSTMTTTPSSRLLSRSWRPLVSRKAATLRRTPGSALTTT